MTRNLMYGAVLSIATGIAATFNFGGAVDKAEAGGTAFNLASLFAPTENYIVHNDTAELSAELRCLALNVYWEARSEPVEGQIAVAAVTLNRADDTRFPADLCGVVQDGGEIRRHRCQFSWWCDGKKDDPLEAQAWRRAEMIARLSYAGVIDDPTDGALWYHADYVKPYWAEVKTATRQIGRHIFYVYPEPGTVKLSTNLSGDLAGN